MSCGVRKAAVLTLGKLEAATLGQHASAIVAKLEDSNLKVRGATVETLFTLQAAGVLADDHLARLTAARSRG